MTSQRVDSSISGVSGSGSQDAIFAKLGQAPANEKRSRRVHQTVIGEPDRQLVEAAFEAHLAILGSDSRHELLA